MNTSKKIAVLGSGVVGKVLADGLIKHGHSVQRGTREPAKLADWARDAGERASVGTFAEASRWADLAVLAVKGTAALAAVDLCEGALAGKTVIDTTNPITESPPENGVIRFFTGPNESLMEQLQKRFPDARFVKAWSSVGNVHMIDPDFGGVKPTMFICGDHAGAKAEVTALLDEVGWESEDMGTVVSARAIEPLCQLWCIPGMLRGQWGHAFKLLKK